VLKADLGACRGYANCVVTAPDIYDIDDDEVVVLLTPPLTSSSYWPAVLLRVEVMEVRNA
jgi:ferredoxin